MSIAIAFDRVSKHYRGAREHRSLREDLMGAAASVLGSRRPRTPVRALDDVSFEIREGTSAALIGVNGAGKTTTLRLATRVAYPTAGHIRVRGRVGALLEVGAGLHPELTGRENVHLYGRILGLSRRDIARRFDEIVAFSGIAHAIDQPVKQYSTGMFLRLGFSVAAHLEPDVLLVDEAIAVGDAGFQYRCVERMATLVQEGRTLVFVSHDMTAVEALCDRALLLRNGRLTEDGPARDVIASYLAKVDAELLAADGGPDVTSDSDLEIVRTTILDGLGRESDRVRAGEPMTVRLYYRAVRPIASPLFNVGLGDGHGGCFTIASMTRDGGAPEILSGEGTLDCTFAELPVLPGVYEVWCAVRGALGFGPLFSWQRLRRFRVESHEVRGGKAAVSYGPLSKAPVVLPYSWRLSEGREEILNAG